jgi:hypothetical protein
VDVESKEMELSGAGERDLGKWKDRFLSIDEVSLCEIQEVPLAAVEGVRIDYGDEDKD